MATRFVERVALLEHLRQHGIDIARPYTVFTDVSTGNTVFAQRTTKCCDGWPVFNAPQD
jgi:hypothetical protein